MVLELTNVGFTQKHTSLWKKKNKKKKQNVSQVETGKLNMLQQNGFVYSSKRRERSTLEIFYMTSCILFENLCALQSNAIVFACCSQSIHCCAYVIMSY